jgi:hypothetical protein
MTLVHLTVLCSLLPHSTDYLLQLHQERSRESIAQEEGLISFGLQLWVPLVVFVTNKFALSLHTSLFLQIRFTQPRTKTVLCM